MRVVIALVLLLFLVACSQEKPQTERIEGEVEIMKIWSNDFKNGDMIPRKFTCQGEDVNPHLALDGVPAGTKSFALIFDDPDAPAGTWIHWIVKDIPADVREIKENSVPGEQLSNSWGKEEYGGPCPPALHRYFFRLYALNVEHLDAENSEELYPQVEEHLITKAELMGKYKKS